MEIAGSFNILPSKQVLFRVFQIAQQIAAIPIVNCLPSGIQCSHQSQHWFRHIINSNALGHNERKDVIWFHLCYKKKHEGLPDHFLLSKLSLVNTALFIINHKKILILLGILPFRKILIWSSRFFL